MNSQIRLMFESFESSKKDKPRAMELYESHLRPSRKEASKLRCANLGCAFARHRYLSYNGYCCGFCDKTQSKPERWDPTVSEKSRIRFEAVYNSDLEQWEYYEFHGRRCEHIPYEGDDAADSSAGDGDS